MTDDKAIEIRALDADDAAAFRQVRLRALRDHPEAFGSSYEEEQASPEDEAARRFRDSLSAGRVMFGAFTGGSLVGLTGIARTPRMKQRHRAAITSVYVAPESRGRGVATALLTAAIQQARAWDGVEVLELSVAVENAAARRLYAAAGFRTYGVDRRALMVDGRPVDLALMALHLAG
jgi:RimJ/RimL family protein N-acetyltransferase